MKKFTLLTIMLMIPVLMFAQAYSLPNTNTGCPDQCRMIPWSAGSDIWNGGSLPVYGQVTCTPLNENGTTDDTTNINNCIAAATAGTGAYATCHAAGGCAVFLPAGTIAINGEVRLSTKVAVRGAGAANTIIKTGASGILDTQNWSWSNTSNLNPTTNYQVKPSVFELNVTTPPQKGDTTVTCSTGCGSVSVGSYIKIFGNDDPTLISDNMNRDGTLTGYYKCDQCADNTGYYLMQQIVKVTGIAGSVFTLSKPLYYTPYASSVTTKDTTHTSITEAAGVHYNIIQFPTQFAGYENLRVTGSTADANNRPLVMFQGCLDCWESGLEVDTSGSGGEASLTRIEFTYGMEIRDGYYHDQRDGSGGSGYGIYAEWINGDAKIENNIVRHQRHPIIFQGGGSGFAILYNYVDDAYTDDPTYNASARTDHGAHPYMILWEGNLISHVTGDDCWGSSSHQVFHRNWLFGDVTGNWTLPNSSIDAKVPTDTSGGFGSPTDPGSGFDAIDLYTGNTYYSFVGNVLGQPSNHAVWASAALRTFNPFALRSAPTVYSYGPAASLTTGGCDAITDSTIPSSDTTSLNHGNYDYKTNGVAYWEGGANHTLANSIYYTSKPAFFGACTWPSIGPDVTPVATTSMPAFNRFSGGACTGLPAIPPIFGTLIGQ